MRITRLVVVRIMKGRRRVESDRLVALRSHYVFESSLCQPGKRGAHEEGGVEGDVGRSAAVTVPEGAHVLGSTEARIGKQGPKTVREKT